VATRQLKRWIAELKNDNAQGEYYLTDIIALAVRDGVEVETHQPAHEWEVLGVNSKAQLAQLERIHQNEIAQALLDAGVTLLDPARLDVRGTLSCGRDVTIDVNCVFEGRVELGDGVQVGANCVLRNVSVATGTRIDAFTLIDDAVPIGEANRLGPFSRIRPGTRLARDVHVGNFVEIKNSQIDDGSKINHLSYVGDTTMGKQVNIGAGTITCNYDGANKHRTVIEDDVFVGSDTQLVAPVTVGRGATLGAGTTLTKDAPAGELTLSRAKQLTLSGWKRPVKQKKEANMCGIVGAVAQRNVVPILLEGLRRLEYRGYDSAGLVIINGGLKRVRSVGRVAALAEACAAHQVQRHARHRPHALGHPRRAVRGQRASARQRQPGGGAQRHHRKPRGAARAASRPRASSSPRKPIPKSSRT
jgi:tetrahydrodipicolinate N-succinyltransferase